MKEISEQLVKDIVRLLSGVLSDLPATTDTKKLNAIRRLRIVIKQLEKQKK